jgi:hypothetical protein
MPLDPPVSTPKAMPVTPFVSLHNRVRVCTVRCRTLLGHAPVAFSLLAGVGVCCR